MLKRSYRNLENQYLHFLMFPQQILILVTISGSDDLNKIVKIYGKICKPYKIKKFTFVNAVHTYLPEKR